MENGEVSRSWNFSHSEAESGKTELSIRGVLNRVVCDLDDGDGRKFIHLGNGDLSLCPLFRTSLEAEDAIVSSLRSAQYNGYASTVGFLPARRAIADYLNRHLPDNISSEDVFLTCGCTQAIEIVISVLARPTANILLPNPRYLFYESRACISGMETRYYNLLPEQNWEVDLEAVEALSDRNTVAIVIINPGNPCGSVFSRQHLSKIAETARNLGLLVIADEVYAHLTFGSNPFIPMATFATVAPVLTLGSISKRWAVPGWRLGWIVTNDPKGVMKEAKIHECIKNYLDVCNDPVTFVQGAIPEILQNTKDDFFNNITQSLKQTVDICYNTINEIGCLRLPYKPEGSMFVMVKVNLPLLGDIDNDMDFCCKLAKEESLLLLPGTVVGLKGWIRISFGTEPKLLEEGLERLKSFCERHQGQPVQY